jgi:hypothetical protein
MIQSQENCLSDNHRFTHARWGGDFDAAPVLNFFPAFFAGIFLKIRQLHAVPDSSCSDGRLSFFVGYPNFTPF